MSLTEWPELGTNPEDLLEETADDEAHLEEDPDEVGSRWTISLIPRDPVAQPLSVFSIVEMLVEG